MTKQARRMFTDDFKRPAVRFTQTSSRTCAQIADDLGIGLSTLIRWRRDHREADIFSGPPEDDYQRLLKNHGIIPSMRVKGNCYDKAMVETVFKTIKSERVWRTCYQTRWEAEKSSGKYSDGVYNPKRRHSAIGYKSPIAFKAIMATTQ